ncbi:MAG: hypothetical protein QG635_2253 [Bacteroidota bacterium]|nr:hypothetical protein [Bacteroidota bacterium]
MHIGNYKINLIDTGLFRLDGGAMFGVVPKTLWSKAYNPGDELNRIPLAARPLLIIGEGRNILIDTGIGTKLNEKLQKIYAIDTSKLDMSLALNGYGIEPEDITDVIFTHLHFDHCGGATIKNNGKIKPTFPNAKYYVQKTQLRWAMHPTEKDRASFFPENFEPLAADGILTTLDGAEELFPGISLIPLRGHTEGMQIVKISDGKDTLLYCADLCPTSAHIPLAYGLGYDNNPLVTLEEKRTLIPQVYEEHWTLCFEHDAFIHASKVISTEKGFARGEEIIINEL